METKKIKSIYKGNKIDCMASHSAESPWKLKIQSDDTFNFQIESNDLFEALKEARIEASKVGLFFLCNGARENVYPSPMSRNMAGGIAAYVLTKGTPASRKNLVKIFEETDELVVSPEQQEKFYSEWLASL